MDRQLFAEYSAQEIEQLLRDNADSIEKKAT